MAIIIYQFGVCFNMSQLTIGSGLDNLGNTCFFNATLQSILHTRALAAILSQHQHSQSCRLKQQHQWCCFC
jgi:ubiquitin C-terminal hydrolase